MKPCILSCLSSYSVAICALYNFKKYIFRILFTQRVPVPFDEWIYYTFNWDITSQTRVEQCEN